MKKFLFLLPLTTSLFACSGEVVESTTDTEDPLRTTTIAAFSSSTNPGEVGLALYGCTENTGSWHVTMDTKKLTGSFCSKGVLRAVDVALDNNNLAAIKSALRQIRPASKPSNCAVDGRSDTLDIERVSSPTVKLALEKYIDVGNSCWATDRSAAKNIDKLNDLLASMSVSSSFVFDSTVSSVQFDRSAGFVYVGPNDKCGMGELHISVDFATNKVTRKRCVSLEVYPPYNNFAIEEGSLSVADRMTFTQKLGALSLTKSASICPTDIPVESVSFTRPSGVTKYFDEVSGCSVGTKGQVLGSTEFAAALSFIDGVALQ